MASADGVQPHQVRGGEAEAAGDRGDGLARRLDRVDRQDVVLDGKASRIEHLERHRALRL